eukprot:1486484-Prymnesium_polylepis.1
MGVGVNAAFRTLPHLGATLRSGLERGGRAALSDAAAAGVMLERWRRAMEGTAADMVQSQLAIIYFEAVCGFVVLGDGHVYRRVRGRALGEMPLDALRSLNCTPAATARSRKEGFR